MARSDRDGTSMDVNEYFDDPASADLDHAEDSETQADDSYDAKPEIDPQQLAKIKQSLAPIPKAGELLEQPSAKAIFDYVDKAVLRQEPLAKNRDEARKHWRYVLEGSQFSILEKSEDHSIYKQIFPPGIDSTPQPIPNKVEDLCGKVISQITVDRFLPDPKPDGADSDRNRAAADLLKKFLRQNGGPQGTNDVQMLNEVLNDNMIGQSSFVWVWTDPMGGGWRPKQVKAHPQATDAMNPLVGPKLDPNGKPIIVNGQPITERTTDPILRYVADVPPSEDVDDVDAEPQPSLVFTPDPAKAARQWVPQIKRRVLTLSQVRCHPPTATTSTARAITLLLWEPLVDAKHRFPILQTLSAARVKELCAWRPKRWRAIVPDAMRPKGAEIAMASNGDVADDTLFFWYHHFCRIGPEYQDGAEIAVTGGGIGKNGFLLCRDTLREDVELEDGTTVPVLLNPAVAQFKALNDPKRGDPAGLAPISKFGGANEIYAQLYTGVLDAIFKGLNPNTYIGANSTVSREDMNRRDGTPIYIETVEDKPTFDQPPVIPAFTPQILERVEMGMNSAAGTNETSNGLDSSYSASGIAKEVSINQAKVALAQYWQNTVNGLVEFWTIVKQHAQAKLTVPQEVMLAGTESAFKSRYFVGADLIGVKEIGLASGTGTMKDPMAKLNLLGAMQKSEWMSKEQAGEVARSSMADDLGLMPDVHEEHIDRQIGVWIEGPPPQWEEQYQSNQEAQATYQTAIQQRVAVLTSQGIDPQTAQQQAQQESPAPQITPLFTPFEPRANDAEPGVAMVRARKLSKLLSTPDFAEQTPPWRALVEKEYNRAFTDSGGQTIAQKAQAAQQQADAQSKGEMDDTYKKFYQDIQNKVMGGASAAIAKVVSGEMNLGAPAPAPESPAPPTVDPTVQLAHDANAATADRAHQAIEADKQRSHTSHENAADRQARLHETALKSLIDAHAKTRIAANRPQPVS